MKVVSSPTVRAAGSRRPPSHLRKDQQERTRARLIAVAREHFSRLGLGGAVAEKIAEEAGFTRGALYANFSGMEELFVAVVQTGVDAELENFRSILQSGGDARERFQRMRQAFASLVSAPQWVLLEAEFQANALRNSAVRTAFVEHMRGRIEEGARLLTQLASQLGLTLRATPEETVLILSTLAEGLAVRQAIARPQSPRAIERLVLLCFDQMVPPGSSSLDESSKQ